MKSPMPFLIRRVPAPALAGALTLTLVAAFGPFGAGPAKALEAASSRKPNIVIVLADDLGVGDLGCYGATKVKTPNLDRLASQSLRFTQAYAPASTCTPSRYALLTGEYAWRQTLRKTSILDGDAPLCIAPGQMTLPKVLKQAGYKSALIGKWHLGLGDGITPVDFNVEIKPGPLEVGFDQAFFIPATVDRVPCVFVENHHVAKLDPGDPVRVSYRARIGNDPIGLEHPGQLKYQADAQHGGTIINGISRIGYMSGGNCARWVDEDIAEVLTRRATAFLTANQPQPFFLYLGLHDPHSPRMPAARFRGTSQCGVRGDVIHQIDWVVGEVIATLERLKLARETIVWFTSDNGPILVDGYDDGGERDANGHKPTGVLRGWKYLVFEGGTRVPFLARWPGHIHPGVTDQLLGLNDLLATAAAIVGQKLPAQAGRDSLNLLPVLLGTAREPVRTEIVEQGVASALALRQGRWKYIPSNADLQISGIGAGADPKDRRFAEARIPAPLLFDLTADPGETNNLVAKHPERAQAMKERLETIRN